MLFDLFQLPDILNPDYMRGYADGYEMARLEVIERVKSMEALSVATGTATNKENKNEHKS